MDENEFKRILGAPIRVAQPTVRCSLSQETGSKPI